MKKIFYWIGAIILFIMFLIIAYFSFRFIYDDLFGRVRTGGIGLGIPLIVPSILSLVWGIFYLFFAIGKREINKLSNISLIFLLITLLSPLITAFVLLAIEPSGTDALYGLGVLVYSIGVLVIFSVISFILALIGFVRGKKRITQIS